MRACTYYLVALAAFSGCLQVDTAFASSGEKQNDSYKNIDAIGHRNLGAARGLGNWYSLDREKGIGKELSVEVEQSTKLLDDPAIIEYVDRVADKIAKNSDVQMPVTVRLVDSEKVEAFTLPGGYQYITRGLLLQLENESELASVLARGIAHSAMRTPTRLMTREQYANIGTLPVVSDESIKLSSNDALNFSRPVAGLKFRRGFESAADYFGVQYVYKAGYSAASFSQIVQKIWPNDPPSTRAFSPFPLTSERLKALQKETVELLPKRDGDIISTPEFEAFSKRLHSWKPSEPGQIH